MKSKFTKIAFVIISAVVICGLVAQSLKQPQQNSADYSYRVIINFDTDMIPNKNLVLAIESLKSDKLRNVLHSKIVRAVFTSRYLDGKLKPEFKQCEDGGWFLIESNNRNNAMELIALLQHYEAIKAIYLEERILMKPASEIHNAPANFPFANQWHLTRGQGINAEDAWRINRGRSDVIIAVLDGGVDYRHPNLDPGDRSRVIAGWDFGSNDSSPMDDLPANPGSFADHGTHIAGIIGAFPTATNQISGVMQNVSIMPLKMVRSGGVSVMVPFTRITATWDFSTTAFPSDVANSIDFAVNNGARVINLSYGFSAIGFAINEVILRIPLLHTAIRNAHNRNVLVVASMGNSYQDGNPVNFPAVFHEVMAVGNTTMARARSASSSTGPHISISAPGTFIYSTSRGGGTRLASGTSMSAPVVAGVAGLIISQGLDRGFNLTNDDVRRIMEITADRAGGADFTNEFGHGIVNAYNALRLLEEPNMVFHWEARARNPIRDHSNKTLILSGGVGGLAAGAYIAHWYWVSERVTFPTPFMETPTVWIRDRQSNTMRYGNPNDGLPWARITNVTTTGFDVQYAAYFVITAAGGGGSINRWIPADRSLIGIAYTVVGAPAPTLFGPAEICAVGTFTIENTDSPVTSWSVPPNSGFSIIESDATSAKVQTRSFTGLGTTLTAMVNGVPITRAIRSCNVVTAPYHIDRYTCWAIPGIRCGWCSQVCPEGAIVWQRDYGYVINQNSCIGCGACRDQCLSGAIVGSRFSVHGISPNSNCISNATTFTLYNHGNHPVSWSVTPSNIFSISQFDRNSARVTTRSHSGIGTLTALVDGTITFTKTIRACYVFTPPPPPSPPDTPFCIDPNSCIDCGACVQACPADAIFASGWSHMIDRNICVECGACWPKCPVDAIVSCYRRMRTFQEDIEPCLFPILYTFFPNPAEAELTIEFKDLNPDFLEIYPTATTHSFDIRLFDRNGRQIRRTSWDTDRSSRSVHFDLRNLPQGTYYLHLETDGQIQKHQIIIQRN